MLIKYVICMSRRNYGFIHQFIFIFQTKTNHQAYDAGKSYDSVAAFKAYRSLYPGILNIGFLIGKPGWGDALLFKPELLRVSQEVSKDKLSGCFFWVYTFSNYQAYYSKPQETSITRQDAVSTASAIFTPAYPKPKPVYTTPSSVFIECPSCKTRILNSWSVPK